MGSTGTAAWIEDALRSGLDPLRLEIVDESAAHAGHAGARGGGGHFAVTVVAARFDGLDRIARHRLVHALLSGRMHSAIHALSLSLHTPAEWERDARPG